MSANLTLTPDQRRAYAKKIFQAGVDEGTRRTLRIVEIQQQVRTFSADPPPEAPKRSFMQAFGEEHFDEAFSLYFNDEHFPEGLPKYAHKFFGMSQEDFGKRAKRELFEVEYPDGKIICKWLDPSRIEGEPPEEVQEFAADRSKLRRVQITNKNGVKTWVWINPNKKKPGEEQPGAKPAGAERTAHPENAALEKHPTADYHSTAQAETAVAQALANPNALTPDHFEALVAHLDTLRKSRLKEIARDVKAKLSGRKAQLVERLLDHLRSQHEPGKEPGKALEEQEKPVSAGGQGGLPGEKTLDTPPVSPEAPQPPVTSPVAPAVPPPPPPDLSKPQPGEKAAPEATASPDPSPSPLTPQGIADAQSTDKSQSPVNTGLAKQITDSAKDPALFQRRHEQFEAGIDRLGLSDRDKARFKGELAKAKTMPEQAAVMNRAQNTVRGQQRQQSIESRKQAQLAKNPPAAVWDAYTKATGPAKGLLAEALHNGGIFDPENLRGIPRNASTERLPSALAGVVQYAIGKGLDHATTKTLTDALAHVGAKVTANVGDTVTMDEQFEGPKDGGVFPGDKVKVLTPPVVQTLPNGNQVVLRQGKVERVGGTGKGPVEPTNPMDARK